MNVMVYNTIIPTKSQHTVRRNQPPSVDPVLAATAWEGLAAWLADGRDQMRMKLLITWLEATWHR